MQVTTADLALVLGVTDRRVQQLETQGVLRKLEHGEWDLAESVQGYLRHRLKAKQRVTPAGGKAEEKLKAAKAAREELKLAVEEGRLIAADEAVATLDDIVGTLRADLAGIPARLTRDMALRERVETEIDAALGRCADRFAERAEALCPGSEPGEAATEDDAGPLGSGEP
jgi:phage terminase Nu1 subunit (DNA packaging protein)